MPSTIKEVIHQCMLGRRGSSGLLVKKPTEVSSNAPEMIEPFRGLKCNGRHQHQKMWGNPKELRQLQVWSWPFAERVAQGTVNLKRRIRRQIGRLAFAGFKGVYPCVGCDSRLPMGRAEHYRIPGERKFHDIDPEKIQT